MPTGRTLASRTAENMANCNQPFADMLELLREKQGGDEVAEQQNRQNQRKHGDDIHGLPQLLASLDVEKRQAEENYREQQHRYILHSMSHFSIGLTSCWDRPPMSLFPCSAASV